MKKGVGLALMIFGASEIAFLLTTFLGEANEHGARENTASLLPLLLTMLPLILLIFLGIRLFTKRLAKQQPAEPPASRAISSEQPARPAEGKRRDSFDPDAHRTAMRELEKDRKRREAERGERDEANRVELERVRNALDSRFNTATEYRPHAPAEDERKLDSVSDETEANWLALKEGASLAEAVEQYLDAKAWLAENRVEFYGVFFEGYLLTYPWRNATTCLCIHSEAEFKSLGERREEILALCRENGLHIFLERGESRYYDYVDQCGYELYISETWPGSADDAATYGNLSLARLEPDDRGDAVR